MTDEQKMLVEFHTKFGLSVEGFPSVPTEATRKLRINLIMEEALEYIHSSNEMDLVNVADALGDLMYVVLGAAVSWGIDLEPVFLEIHRSNMTKVWDDGTVKRRKDGKILKPPTYKPPDIMTELVRQADLRYAKYEKEQIRLFDREMEEKGDLD